MMRTLVIAVMILAASSASAQVPNACQVPRDAPMSIAWMDPSLAPQVCNNTQRINETWDHFHMSEGGWDGYGLKEDACTANTALSRTFMGLMLMRDSGASPTCEPAESLLNWAYCYSSGFIVKLVAGCYDPEASAKTFTWGLDQWNERTEVYFDFYYNYGPPMRASTILHEARHADDDCSHTSGCMAGTEACDPQWEHGCVTGEGKGAYAWGAIWLHRYAVEAVPAVINQDLRAYAANNAAISLAWNFDVTPCFTYDIATGHAKQIEGCTQ